MRFLGILLSLLWVSEAHAAAAIALSKDKTVGAVLGDLPTLDEAEAAALKECQRRGGRGCYIQERWRRMCVAATVNRNDKRIYYGLGPSPDGARERLFYLCPTCTNVQQQFCDEAPVRHAQPQTTPPVQQYSPPQQQVQQPHWSQQQVRKQTYPWDGVSPHAFVGIFVVCLGVVVLVFLAFLTPKAPPQLNLPEPTGDQLLNAALKTVPTKKGFTLYLTIKFSQEAKRIIEGGRLKHVLFSAPTAPNTPEAFPNLFFFLFKGVAFLPIPLFIYSFYWGVLGGGEGAGLTMIAAVVLFLYLRFGPVPQFNAGEVRDFTIPDFLKTPTVQLYASNIVEAKVLENKLQESVELLRETLPSLATMSRDRVL